MGSKSPVMFRIKPTFELKSDIAIPTNMYKMKNIHSNSAISQKESESGIKIIQKRQQSLLQKLSEIKALLNILKEEVAMPKIESVSKMSGKPNFSEFGITHDVVLNLSTNKQHPPYSLLVLDKIWPDCFLKYSWHLHSSALFLPPAFKQFQEELESKTRNCNPDLNIRVVWKKTDRDCEFVISPIKSVPLGGEVNILRFLNSSFYSKCDVIEQTLMDEKLDACYCLTRCKSNNDMKPYLQILSNRLEDNNWLCGNSITIVDVAAWSVFKQMKKYNLSIEKLNNWFKRCNKFLDG